jgi:hypothetical protein
VRTEECFHPNQCAPAEVLLLLMPILIAEPGVFSDAEVVGAPVSYQRCDALEELAEASDPQKEELNMVDVPKQDEDEGDTYTWCACFHLFSEATAPKTNRYFLY